MSKEQIVDEINEIKAAMNDPHLAEGTAQTYSRISGYYRNVDLWNAGKEAEFKDRKQYNVA